MNTRIHAAYADQIVKLTNAILDAQQGKISHDEIIVMEVESLVYPKVVEHFYDEVVSYHDVFRFIDSYIINFELNAEQDAIFIANVENELSRIAISSEHDVTTKAPISFKF
ncbi:hypothetical protein [Photobacterium damselae]|uniref:hypothetical protein n=1 Tax=Photobacterium damselae TaxID=38293 RepID=UPI00165DC7E7|nr:hypothetical protein [Photobacterium damselae]